MARQGKCAREVQLGHCSQLDLAGSSHTAQRTASLAASRASLALTFLVALSDAPSAPALHSRTDSSPWGMQLVRRQLQHLTEPPGQLHQR